MKSERRVGRDAARSLLSGGAQTRCAHWRGGPFCGCLVPRLRLVPRKSSALDGIVRPVSLPCCHHVEVRSLLGRDAARDGFTSDIHTRCLRIIPPFLVGWRELQNVQRV